MEALFAAFGLVFVAELGDKTQLLAVGLGARHRFVPVATGVVIGYAAANLVSVVIGGLLGAALPTRAIGLLGGVAFVGFGLWTLRGDDDDETPEIDESTSVVRSVATAMFVAELGDKTMLATATLAAQGSPVATWIGATGGMIAAGLLGVVVGNVAGARLPERVTRIGAAVLFIAVGVVLIVSNLR